MAKKKQETQTYKILKGFHFRGSGKEQEKLEKGAKVKSSQDLAKLFPNKFKKVSTKRS